MNYQQTLSSHYKAVRARIANPKCTLKTLAPMAALEAPEPAPGPQPDPPRSWDPRVNILRGCANEYGCTVADIFSASRKQKIVFARRKSMWLLYQRRTMSKAHIGRFFNKDHTTVIHALRSYEKDLAKGGDVR